MRKLSVGDRVLCRFYNTPDKRFYGSEFTGIIKGIDISSYGEKTFLVKQECVYPQTLSLHRKEIIRRVVP